MAENARHYCIAIADRPTELGTKAALVEEFKWPLGTQISVQFLGGDETL